MVDWEPGLSLPAQVADAFAILYDWLDRHHPVDPYNDDWEIRVRADPKMKQLQRAVALTSQETPSALEADIFGEMTKGNKLNTAYAVFRGLWAIDGGVERQLPKQWERQRVGPGFGLLAQFDQHARFNTDAVDGYVLPKLTRKRYRGEDLADHFKNLVRANINQNRVRVLGRQGRNQEPSRTVPGNQSVVVVPFLYRLQDDSFGFGDATFSGVTRNGNRYFEVQHNEQEMQALEERVRSAVVAVRRSGAMIAVFPELALNEQLFKTLRDALDQTNTNPEDRLEWVIAGAALPPPAPKDWPRSNMACVLDGGGNIVSAQRDDGSSWWWKQEKHHPYKLSKDEQVRYGIESCFPDLHDRLEATPLSNHLYVFDSGTRRTAVVICEDLAQEERTVTELRKLRCSLVITIVMDGPVIKGRWAVDRACAVADQTGGCTVVANSLLLPNSGNVREYSLGKERDAWLVREAKRKADPYLSDPYLSDLAGTGRKA